jgi:hypothetical protein
MDAEAVAVSDQRKAWTEYVEKREREARKNAKPARKRRARKPEPTQQELEAALDDLVSETRLDSRGNTPTNT